jgi:hypothetical protein
MTTKDIAPWTVIAIAAAGLYYQNHADQKDTTAQIQAQQDQAVKLAVEQTKRDSNLSAHLTELDKRDDFIADHALPEDMQKIEHQFFRQEQAALNSLGVNEPVMAQHGMRHHAVGVSADAPKEEKP